LKRKLGLSNGTISPTGVIMVFIVQNGT